MRSGKRILWIDVLIHLIITYSIPAVLYLSSPSGASVPVLGGTWLQSYLQPRVLSVILVLAVLSTIREIIKNRPNRGTHKDVEHIEHLMGFLLDIVLKDYYEQVSIPDRDRRESVSGELVRVLASRVEANSSFLSMSRGDQAHEMERTLLNFFESHKEHFNYSDVTDQSLGTFPMVRANVMLIRHYRGKIRPRNRKKLKIIFTPTYGLFSPSNSGRNIAIRVYNEIDRNTEWMRGDGKCGKAWELGTHCIYDGNEPAQYPIGLLREQREYFEEHYDSVLSIPIKNIKRDKVIAILNLDSAQNGEFTKFTHPEVLRTAKQWSVLFSYFLTPFDNGIVL